MAKRILVAILTVSLVVVGVVMYWTITSPRRQLDRFLRETATVEIGKTKLEDWRARVEGDLHSKVDAGCDVRSCSLGLMEENSFLRRVHLAPQSRAFVHVDFTDGIASAIHINLWILKRDEIGGRHDIGGWHDDKGVVVEQAADAHSNCQEHYKLETNVIDIHRGGHWARVTMDSCVSPDDRAKALAINASCLTRIGGCKTVESMLPKVFAQPESLSRKP